MEGKRTRVATQNCGCMPETLHHAVVMHFFSLRSQHGRGRSGGGFTTGLQPLKLRPDDWDMIHYMLCQLDPHVYDET